MNENELSRMLSGRQIEGVRQGNPRLDKGAFALCRLLCNGVRPGKTCEHYCAGETDQQIQRSSHMNQMRALAAAVLES